MGNSLAEEIGRIGIWSIALASGDPGRRPEIAEAAAELEALGYGAVWLGGSPPVDRALPLLEATRRLRVATGILNVWSHEPAEVAEGFAEANAAHGDRFLLGLGVSHSANVPRYRRPLEAMRDFLTGLDGAARPVPPGRRVLAALGPKMLRLSAERAAGAHPYLVTAEHVAGARVELGRDALLAPELKVVLDPDLTRARATARSYLSYYLELENYTRNFLRLGFTEDDFADGGSDRLLSEVFALGDVPTVRAKVDEFLTAGADHVALQVVTEDTRNAIPLDAYRRLAEALSLTAA
ncbi:LLM class F420-dependent oxidoreductase [Streptomyces hoynatensis]|uniref:LLM class F420-dependent oxidoreductase n=1 Tax=Streptomyces hoynatensis TaxID=1141874 RepID=A0A3A9YPW3_9ACTN|nr:LLM class F420-dependent oxidoreductase [Streptomyces hoynatensis]RKN37979.1 LLM class F420-dependent oxidoreductase [Streptomyces hoynatensis]